MRQSTPGVAVAHTAAIQLVAHDREVVGLGGHLPVVVQLLAHDIKEMLVGHIGQGSPPVPHALLTFGIIDHATMVDQHPSAWLRRRTTPDAPPHARDQDDAVLAATP